MKKNGWSVDSLNLKGSLNPYVLTWMSEMEIKSLDWRNNLENEFTKFLFNMIKYKHRQLFKTESEGVMTIVEKKIIDDYLTFQKYLRKYFSDNEFLEFFGFLKIHYKTLPNTYSVEWKDLEKSKIPFENNHRFNHWYDWGDLFTEINRQIQKNKLFDIYK